MPVDPIVAPDRESLTAMEESLEGMMSRLRDLVAQDALTEDGLVEITSMYNNVGYIFLYLEANDEFVNYQRLIPWRDAFHKNPDLDRRIHDLLLRLRCTDPEAEESRLAYLAQLEEKLQAPDPALEEEHERLLDSAKEVLGDIRKDQVRLLERLGAAVGATNPGAVFYRLASRTGSAATRTKLARAWTVQRDGHEQELLDRLDRMIAARRRLSAAAGHRTVLARTLDKCGVGEAEVEAFLGRYLDRALAGQQVLEDEIRDVVGPTDAPLDHFGFAIRTAFGPVEPPLFDLDACLAYIFTVARSVFGLTVTEVGRSDNQVITVRVGSGATEVGEINFDLWNTDGRTAGANHTRGIRNRTDWTGLLQHPVAYVSCRFRPDPRGAGRITFQNAHSLFHEFGHAVNHLLIRKRISNRSGLEYLPLERLEYLSMWFEKWVYHPEFATLLSLGDQDRDGLALSRRIKMLEYRRTYAERAVTAVLDFEVHRRTGGDLATVFRDLDDRYGLTRHCRLGDFLAYFTWPMFTANPGANFSYLMGASDSARKFTAFRALDLDRIAERPPSGELFANCFDYDLPTEIPDSEALFAFYDRATLARADAGAPPDPTATAAVRAGGRP
ncbi:M3 family metallopeptidase [Kitasatospora cinereorecta]|uniref:M3 family metallopeptidase n=1 Tax=Kitasatospora cinereorecta TaxID=285560 RepID=A0ABW0V9X8_9ACTN